MCGYRSLGGVLDYRDEKGVSVPLQEALYDVLPVPRNRREMKERTTGSTRRERSRGRTRIYGAEGRPKKRPEYPAGKRRHKLTVSSHVLRCSALLRCDIALSPIMASFFNSAFRRSASMTDPLTWLHISRNSLQMSPL